jgi:hypothetical protein
MYDTNDHHLPQASRRSYDVLRPCETVSEAQIATPKPSFDTRLQRSKAKSPLASVAIILLCFGIAACGGTPSRTNATTASNSTGPTSYLKSDGDSDGDDASSNADAGEFDDDTQYLATYGKGASQADKLAIVALVKRYYTAATANRSAQACSLLDSSLAAQIAEGQEQSLQHSDNSCAAILSRLLMEQSDRLTASDIATMVVIDVRVRGNLGLAVLGFKAKPVSEILVERESNVWKIDALAASEMT